MLQIHISEMVSVYGGLVVLNYLKEHLSFFVRHVHTARSLGVVHDVHVSSAQNFTFSFSGWWGGSGNTRTKTYSNAMPSRACICTFNHGERGRGMGGNEVMVETKINTIIFLL